MRALFVTVFLLTLLIAGAAIFFPFYFVSRVGKTIPETTREAGDVAVKVIDAFGRLLKTEAWTTITAHETLGTEGKLDLVLVSERGFLKAERSARWLYVSDLVVEADVIYTLNFFVPLDSKDWLLEAKQTEEGRVKLRAVAPALQITKEKISSEVKRINTKDNSRFISKEPVISDLLKVLYDEHLLPIAEKKRLSPAIRETARVKTRQFVRDWIVKQYPESSVLADLAEEDIQVVFADEPARIFTQEPAAAEKSAP